MSLRLIQRCWEFCPKSGFRDIGEKRRGIYVLYRQLRKHRKENLYTVVYIGMANQSIRRRLRSHSRSKRKKWTHFSAYEVWPNITKEEILETEGLIRHIYRHDRRANIFNRQRRYKAMSGIRVKNVQ